MKMKGAEMSHKILNYSLILLVLLNLNSARADFGEIEIIVEESLESYFSENHQEVDLTTLSYIGKPDLQNTTMKISTAVKAESGLTGSGWAWYDCETLIQINEKETFTDLGSNCLPEIE